MLPHQSIVSEEVLLLRGGAIVTNLLGAFGQSLKETRLTALLGYLLAMRPEPLMTLLGFTGRIISVRLEMSHDECRSDILVETSCGLGVIEAKVDTTDASAQSIRYPARWRVLLTFLPGVERRGVTCQVHWQQLADRLEVTALTGSPTYRFLVAQFIAHLEEHHMIKTPESLEINAREINEPVTLSFFIQGHIYGCRYEKKNKVARAQYFAPHFGTSIARHQPGIFTGVSYVARVEHVFLATTWKEFSDGVCEYRGRQWWNSHIRLLNDLHREWYWTKGKQRSFLLLGEPRLAFNPPVRKERLQTGKGWLSRRFFSFDDLFAAWGHG